jgi:biopolymer transport protein ExbD
MAMNVGGGGGVKAEINITPLVDVVLVLLIIFMVITPLLQMGHPVNVPPEVETNVPPPLEDQIIVRLDAQGQAFINKDPVTEEALPETLKRILHNRENDIIFFAADGELEYDRVARFLDLCRDNGAKNIGIVFDDLRPAG